MANTIGELVIRLRAESASFIQDLGKGRAATTAFGVATGTILADLSKKFTQFGFDAAAAFPRLIESMAELGDKLNDASEKTGVSVRNLSGLHAVTRSVGEDFDGLSSALAKAGVNITKALADPSDKANARLVALMGGAKGLAEFGLKPMDDRIQEVLKSIFALSDTGQRNLALQQLLGKGWQTNIETLTLLAQQGYGPAIEQARKFGELFDAESARQAQELGLQFKELTGTLEGLAKVIAIRTIPAMLDNVKAVNIWMQSWMNQGFWSGLFSTIDTALTKFKLLSNVIPGAQLYKPILDIWTSKGGSDAWRTGQTNAMSKAAAELQAQMTALAGVGRGSLAMPEIADNAAVKKAEEAAKRQAEILREMRSAGAGSIREDADKELQNRINLFLGLEAAMKHIGPGIEDSISKAELAALTLSNEQSAALKAMQEAAHASLREIDNLEMGQRIARHTSRQWAQEMTMLTQNIGTAFEDAILGGKGLRDIFSGLAEEAARFTLRLLVIQPLMEKLFGVLNAQGQSGGGWLSKLFGIATKAVTGLVTGGVAAPTINAPDPQFSFKGFAGGGVVPSTGLAMLHANEMVLPANIANSIKSMAGGSGVTMNQSIVVNAQGAAPGVENNIRQMLREVHKQSVIDAVAAVRELQLRTA